MPNSLMMMPASAAIAPARRTKPRSFSGGPTPACCPEGVNPLGNEKKPTDLLRQASPHLGHRPCRGRLLRSRSSGVGGLAGGGGDGPRRQVSGGVLALVFNFCSGHMLRKA
jgi:hypothetical protein